MDIFLDFFEFFGNVEELKSLNDFLYKNKITIRAEKNKREERVMFSLSLSPLRPLLFLSSYPLPLLLCSSLSSEQESRGGDFFSSRPLPSLSFSVSLPRCSIRTSPSSSPPRVCGRKGEEEVPSPIFLLSPTCTCARKGEEGILPPSLA